MIALGIDSGTQSTKTVALDLASGEILASASQAYGLIEGLPPGHLEQEPQKWLDAVDATVRCSCGNTFATRSTKAELNAELCNECHPFFTGKQKLVDSGGRVERFQRRYGPRGSARSKRV